MIEQKKTTSILALLAFIECFANIVMYGENINGLVTFLYIGTALALVSQVFMMVACFAPDHHRQTAMKHGMIGVVGIIVVDVIFAIPSIQWINRYVEYIN